MQQRNRITSLQQFVLLTIILIRAMSFVIPSFSIDMTAWQAWAARLAESGPWQFYSPTIWTNYTPGYLLFLWLFGSIFALLSLPVFSLGFELVIKITTTAFDCATAYIIYLIIRKYQSSTLGTWGALAYLANPASIINTSIWGQVDGVLAFFLLLSIYYAYEVKDLTKTFFFYLFSILIKPQSIAILPMIFFSLLQKKPYQHLGKAIALSTGFYLLVNALFFPNDILFGLVKLVIQMSKDYAFTSLYAFNLWDIVGWWQNDSILWNGLPYKVWGYILYAIAIMTIGLVYFKKRNVHQAVPYLAATLYTLAFFIFPTRVHERYLFPVFAFLIIAACLTKSRLLFWCYSAIALIHALNIWFVYYYYVVLYNKPAVTPHVIYTLTDRNHQYLSILTIGIFGIIFIVFLKLRPYGSTKQAL